MSQTLVMERLTGIFREVFDDPDLVLAPNTTADDIADWDSMTHITIVIEVERRFGVKFQTAEIEELRNVGELAHLIVTKLAKQGRQVS